MRLKSLWIDGFKNLNDFNINFKNRDGLTVLIGNNASGKSNILEAISAIFSHIYDDNLTALSFKFNFVLEYSQYNLEIRITKKNSKVKFESKGNDVHNDWEEVKNFYKLGFVIPETTPKTLKNYSPSQVIALYSGEELRLWEDYYQNFYVKFFNSLLKQKVSTPTPRMLYINKYSWQLGLIALFCFDSNDAKKFIKENFNIALADGIDINFSIDEAKYEGFRGNEALNLIKRIKSLSDKDGFINTNTLRTLDIGNQQITIKQIFSYLYIASSPVEGGKLGVKITRIINDIKIDQIDIKSLSEGQKKQILLKLALEVLADENSLLLFDEPDAHIHIANKKLIPDMLKEYSNREIILTTHSPTLAHSFDIKHLAYVENGKINTNYNKQSDILYSISGGSMGVSEQMMFLQSKKDILVVEGKTDETYISTALKVLKKSNPKYKDLDFNFLWLGGTDTDTFKKVTEELTPKKGQTIIAFFDSDDTGYGCIKNVLDIDTKKKDFKGKTINNIHIHLYPKKDKFEQSNFEVEDYFPIEVLKKHFDKNIQTFQDLKGKFNKVKFTEECKKDNFDKSNFDGFKTLFDLILETKTKL